MTYNVLSGRSSLYTTTTTSVNKRRVHGHRQLVAFSAVLWPVPNYTAC